MGRRRVVWELKHLPDSVLSITLKTSTGEETLLKDGTERVLKSAKIAWTKDSNIFAVRVFCGGEDLIFAYDTKIASLTRCKGCTGPEGRPGNVDRCGKGPGVGRPGGE